jgi:hypothetical protein
MAVSCQLCAPGVISILRRQRLPPHLPSRQSGIVYFNDRLCARIAELRSVITKARTLALEDAEVALAAAALERKLLAEVECYRAAKVSIRPATFDRRSPAGVSEVEQPTMKQAA